MLWIIRLTFCRWPFFSQSTVYLSMKIWSENPSLISTCPCQCDSRSFSNNRLCSLEGWFLTDYLTSTGTSIGTFPRIKKCGSSFSGSLEQPLATLRLDKKPSEAGCLWQREREASHTISVVLRISNQRRRLFPVCVNERTYVYLEQARYT